MTEEERLAAERQRQEFIAAARGAMGMSPQQLQREATLSRGEQSLANATPQQAPAPQAPTVVPGPAEQLPVMDPFTRHEQAQAVPDVVGFRPSAAPASQPDQEQALANPMAFDTPVAANGYQGARFSRIPGMLALVDNVTGEVISGTDAEQIVGQIQAGVGREGPTGYTNEDAASGIQLLQGGYAGAPGAAPTGNGGMDRVKITTTQDVMSEADPRALARAALARHYRVAGEMGVRDARAGEYLTSAANQGRMADRVEQDAQVALAEQRANHADLRTRQAAVDDLIQQAGSGRVNPGRFLGNGWNSAGAVLATALGALGSGIAGGPNAALQIIEHRISQDIAAQESDIDTQGNHARMAQDGLNQFRRLTQDEQAARDAYRASYLGALQLRSGALQTTASGIYADRLAQLSQLLEAERLAAAQVAQHRIGTVQTQVETRRPAGTGAAMAMPGAAPQQPQQAPRQAAQRVAPPATPVGQEQPAQGQESASTGPTMVALPGIGRVMVSPQIARLAQADPNAAAAQFLRERGIRPGGIEADLATQAVTGVNAAAGLRLPDLQNARLAPDGERAARFFLNDAGRRDQLLNDDVILGLAPEFLTELEQLRERARARPGNLAGLLASPEFANARGMIFELRNTRQITSGRAAPAEGELELLESELPWDSWSASAVPGLEEFDSTILGLQGMTRAWMRSVQARMRAAGYVPNTVRGAMREESARAAGQGDPSREALRRAAGGALRNTGR